jgi:catechol 2,3-dioxygenase-like lactoylglutathione lyase family enzyme
MTPLTLDHIVIAVRDLDAAARSYRRLLGRAPSWRGRHPSYGTANALFRLDNTYIELLAPDPEGDSSSPWLAALRTHLDTTGEGLYAIALGTGDIDHAVAAARKAGLIVADPADGDGVDLQTGALRRWRNARIDAAGTRNLRLFFIQHLSPPDALPTAPPDADAAACPHAVDHTVVASSDLAAGLTLWRDTLGLDLRATVDFPPPDGPRRLCFLLLGQSILELAGEREPKTTGERDLLWGVSYRAADVAACVDRLRAEGLVVSDVRIGNAPGTLVADLRPGFSHDVRTLFIQKEVRP